MINVNNTDDGSVQKSLYQGPSTLLRPHPEVIRGFINYWFEFAQGSIEIAWRDPYTKKINHAAHFNVRDHNLEVFACDVNAVEGQDVYFTPSIVNTVSGRSSDSNFVSAPGFWVDQDELADINYANSLDHEFKPTSYVFTGRTPDPRRQMWFRLDQPTSDIALVRETNGRLVCFYKGDPSVVNPSRLMRLPGCISFPWKPGRTPELVSWEHPTDGRARSHPISLIDSLPELPMPQLIAQKTGGNLPSVSALVGRIKAGDLWHTNMVQLVGHWLGRGLADQEILVWAPELTLEGYSLDETIEEMQRAIDDGRNKWNVPNKDRAATTKLQDAQAAFRAAPLSDEDCKPAKTLSRIIIHGCDLPRTARELGEHLKNAGDVFDLNGPVKIVPGLPGQPPRIIRLNKHGITNEAHSVCIPGVVKKGEFEPKQLPDKVADLYLNLPDWKLPKLSGVTSAPFIDVDGRITVHEGYDFRRKLWCRGVTGITPDLLTDITIGREYAENALARVRYKFATFPFADSGRIFDNRGIERVDLARPPGMDESAFLNGLFTAIARSSLHLAPGFLLTAPDRSGAGVGKGLLARAICIIAFGHTPHVITAGHEAAEFDKRIVAEIINGSQVIFVDNINGMTLKSDALASLLTERPTRLRPLGTSKSIDADSNAFVTVNGNGLAPGEDLIRRFVVCRLDARTENPEGRSFDPGFLNRIVADRHDILSHALAILKWGRQNASELIRGKPLGSFEDWAVLVRDPLITLNCRDPAERIAAAKADDPGNLEITEFFAAWYEKHGERLMEVTEIDLSVKALINPQQKSRQFYPERFKQLNNTRSAGYLFTVHPKSAAWSNTRYQVTRT